MIQKDKHMHFSVNVIVVIITTQILLLFGLEPIPAYTASIFFAIGLSVGKEYGDSKAIGNRWDWMDILADAIGIVFGVFMSIQVSIISKAIVSVLT